MSYYRHMKTIPLVVLGILSLVLSRSVFFLINDPEGPNLLVVAVLAAIIFAVSVAVYTGVRRFRRSA